MKGPDPKNTVTITRVAKRGEHYTIEGVAEGKRSTVHIPAPSLEGQPASAAEALMRRSLLGSKHMADRGEHRESS